MNRTPVLFLNVLVVATCGLVYELLAGTLASYVLGDSVTQFSLIIGIYLSALGAGAWLSRFLERDLARRFVEVELSVAVLGGASAPLLFLSFAHLSFFHVVLYAVVFMIGALVGLEIPLLMRILKDQLDFKELVARVLAFDYAGALIASLLFPIFLVPKLGLVRTSLLFGFLNAGVGLWATWLMRPLIGGGVTRLRAQGCVVMALLAVAFIKADAITSLSEDAMFADDIVYSRTTPYQRIVITRNRAGFQLFLNGNLQFSSADEYRYHEALVHPPLALASEGGREVRSVLVLGGGDGLALREILKYPAVRQVTLVDLDPDMTRLSERFPPLARLNDNSFRDPRVRVVNEDAMIWLERDAPASDAAPQLFDAAIVDFPDPNTFALGKLYTTRFYRLLKSRLAPGAAVSVQSTSPLFARNSFWCIVRTLEAAGFAVRPYYTAVPSFGVWGFALARREPFDVPRRAPSVPLKFLDDDSLAAMFTLSADLGPVPVEVNRLDNQSLVRYYEAEWRRYE
ncbi:MAG TPA: polyamine aminopropyltransferase [Pyrinomonadaceae bacterium]|jgi:spermidine synthase|nr:polyamine aminopropyltransferase [Pyrinomonadaceae bacterium]